MGFTSMVRPYPRRTGAVPIRVRITAYGRSRSSPSCRRLQLDLQPAGKAVVEGPVGVDRVADLVELRDHGARVDHAGPHELDEFRDVAAVVAVAQPDRQVLGHRLADREVLRLRRIDAD